MDANINNMAIQIMRVLHTKILLSYAYTDMYNRGMSNVIMIYAITQGIAVCVT